MTTLPTANRWGRTSDRYRSYAETARDLLAEDPAFERAQREWVAFFEASHGDVFAKSGADVSLSELFVDVLYFDFVVDRVLDRLEEAFDVRLTNREASANTDALAVPFGDLHDRVCERAGEGSAVDSRILLDREALLAADGRFIRELYEAVVSRTVRLELGEYYTPRGLAELAVDELDFSTPTDRRFLDPGCGSGMFLAVCVERLLADLDDAPPADALATVTGRVVGIDLNPVAVKSAKLAYLLALLPLVEAEAVQEVAVPVFLTDALGLSREDELRFRGESLDLTVDALVGNPPWLTWDRLSTALQRRWRERYVDRLDLLAHEGRESLLGYANDDLSVPFVLASLARYLADGGRASFVLKRTIVERPAGRRFRRLEVDGRPLELTHVHDFGGLQPFGDVTADAAIYTLAADADHAFPVPRTVWERTDATPDFASASTLRASLAAESAPLVPIDPDDPAAEWIPAGAERAALGDCAHEIRHGVKDDAAAVFSVDRDALDDLEPDLVYPYLKSRHVVGYGLFGHDLHLVPVRKVNEDNEAELESSLPATYDYLTRHRETLDGRASSWFDAGPFYNVFGVGEYTWAPYKVAWCRLGFSPNFVVLSTVEDPDLGEKPVVPGDHYMFIPTDSEREAHYLCALLNSALYEKCLRDVASEGKASLSKTAVSRLRLPAFPDTDRARRLADLSMAAHEVVAEQVEASTNKREYRSTRVPELEAIQAEIDRLVEELLDGSSTTRPA